MQQKEKENKLNLVEDISSLVSFYLKVIENFVINLLLMCLALPIILFIFTLSPGDCHES
jgi:hypothetical protein